MGKHGTYVFTQKELERALDRENYGVAGEVKSEADFTDITDEWYKADLNEETETYENREEWLTLAEYSLSRIKHSAHDKKKRQTISEFLNDLKTVMENTIREINT
jgi:hypothetical protein